MTNLIFRNQELESGIDCRDLSGITDGLIHGTAQIPDIDIREINSARTFLYTANNLVITLEEAGGEALTNVFANGNVRVNGFWKTQNASPDSPQFAGYQRFDTDADVLLSSPGRIVIRINDSDEQQIQDHYRSLGIAKPDYGMLLITVPLCIVGDTTVYEYAFLLKYTHNPLFSSPTTSLLEPPAITANRYKSGAYSFETFFIPTISSSFVYNFFEPEEADYDVYAQRSYKNQKLTDIPKYNKLTWTKPLFDSALFERENIPLLVNMVSGSVSTYPGVVDFGIFLTSSENPPQVLAPTEIDERDTRVVRMGGMVFSLELNSEIASVFGTAGTRTAGDADFAFDGTIDSSREVEAGLAGTPSVTLPPGFREPEVDPAITFDASQEVEITTASKSDYIGYIIEKSRLNEDGVFNVIDLITIIGRDQNEYIDANIAYGEVYRYRIRSVFRFVNKYRLSMFADTDSSITRGQTINYLESNEIVLNNTFYFDGFFSKPTEIQTTEVRRPHIPSGVRLFPNSRKKNIFISWTQKNENRDVIGFNVYRKIYGQTNFVKVNSDMLDPRQNSYFDFDIEPDIYYQYAIEAVDFHGNFSPLSIQFYTKIQEVNLDSLSCEDTQHFAEWEGLELGELREVSEKSLVIAKRNFVMNINPLFRNLDENTTFVIRVTSLDTGLKKEIKLNFRQLTIYLGGGYRPDSTFSIQDAVEAFGDTNLVNRLIP